MGSTRELMGGQYSGGIGRAVFGSYWEGSILELWEDSIPQSLQGRQYWGVTWREGREGSIRELL